MDGRGTETTKHLLMTLWTVIGTAARLSIVGRDFRLLVYSGHAQLRPRSRGSNCAWCVVIYENECGQSSYACERAHYVRALPLRAAWLLRARRGRGDARPDDDDVQRRGDERPPRDDAHLPDASVTVPSIIPPLLRVKRHLP
jgi:hypothetical protein